MMKHTPVSPATTFREVTDQLRKNVTGIQAVVLVALNGTTPMYSAVDADFHADIFAFEYSTLLRIARSTSQDLGAGELTEYIAVSDQATTISRRVDGDSFLVVVLSAQDQIGRARYEIKRATSLLDRQ